MHLIMLLQKKMMQKKKKEIKKWTDRVIIVFSIHLSATDRTGRRKPASIQQF